jgi:hypothetical protein
MAYLGLVLPATGERTAVDQIAFAPSGELRNAQLVKLGAGVEGAYVALVPGPDPSPSGAGSLPVVLAPGVPIAVSLLEGEGATPGSALIGTVKVVTAGNAAVSWDGPQSSTVASITATINDTTLMTSNGARMGGSIFNDSTADLFVLYTNGTASQTVYSLKMAPGSYAELPICKNGVYRGVIKGVWSAPNGSAKVTEFNP